MGVGVSVGSGAGSAFARTHAYLVVVLPQVAVPPLAGHVEHGEAEVALGELLDGEADGRHDLRRCRLPRHAKAAAGSGVAGAAGAQGGGTAPSSA